MKIKHVYRTFLNKPVCRVASCIALSTCLGTALVSHSAYAATAYQVANVASNDSLNMRSLASVKGKIVSVIPYNAKGIKPTGKKQKNGRTVWAQVVWQGKTGWVSTRYIAPTPTAAPAANGAISPPRARNTVANNQARPQRAAPAPSPLAPARPTVSAEGAIAQQQGRNIRISEKIVGNNVKEVKKPQASRGTWVLQCGSASPYWLIEVFPKHLEVETNSINTSVPITAKHQEKSAWNTALKTVVRGRNQAKTEFVGLDINYTRNCKDTFLNKKAPYSVKASYNGKTMWGCCKAVRVD